MKIRKHDIETRMIDALIELVTLGLRKSQSIETVLPEQSANYHECR